jgi:hypothetical protein
MRTNIWPAVQFNFVWTDENPKRSLNENDEVYLKRNIPFPGCGLVDIRFYSARVLITTTIPSNQHLIHQARFEDRLRDELKQIGIL